MGMLTSSRVSPWTRHPQQAQRFFKLCLEGKSPEENSSGSGDIKPQSFVVALAVVASSSEVSKCLQ